MGTIYIIAAVADFTGVIGKNRELPWEHLPEDMATFQERTKGNIIVMGNETFKSLDCRALGGRINVVLTKEKYKIRGVTTFSSLQALMEWLEKQKQDIYIIGGAEIYSYFIGTARAMFITRVGKNNNKYIKGDIVFPKFDPVMDYRISSTSKVYRTEKYWYHFEVWTKTQ